MAKKEGRLLSLLTREDIQAFAAECYYSVVEDGDAILAWNGYEQGEVIFACFTCNCLRVESLGWTILRVKGECRCGARQRLEKDSAVSSLASMIQQGATNHEARRIGSDEEQVWFVE